MYHPSAIQYDSESGHSQNPKGTDKILISLITEEQKASTALKFLTHRKMWQRHWDGCLTI